jgi:tRNA-dihydrouridine synthase B
MKIASLELPEKALLLAPMEDVTDSAFRLMCKQFGADMVYTEFVSSDALIRNVSKTNQKLRISDEERPVAVQIYGKDPATMARAAQICEEAGPDILDINFGCPVRKIASKGAGAGLLNNIPLMLEITRAVVDAVKIPVTVKTRLGWDEQSKIIVDLAERLQDCGIAALSIHGRTRSQMYTGKADWTLIAEVCNNPRMHIPIIGNGDIDSGEICLRRFNESGVAAVMIGRACIGRPWIFKEIKHYLATGTELELDNRWKSLRRHTNLRAHASVVRNTTPGDIPNRNRRLSGRKKVHWSEHRIYHEKFRNNPSELYRLHQASKKQSLRPPAKEKIPPKNPLHTK